MNHFEIINRFKLIASPYLPITTAMRLKKPPRHRKKRLMKKWLKNKLNWACDMEYGVLIDQIHKTIICSPEVIGLVRDKMKNTEILNGYPPIKDDQK